MDYDATNSMNRLTASQRPLAVRPSESQSHSVIVSPKQQSIPNNPLRAPNTSSSSLSCAWQDCTQTCSNSAALLEHLTAHVSNVNTACLWRDCPRVHIPQPTKYTLLAHLRRHAGERTYECDVCGKPFSRSDALAKHMKTIHTDAGVTEQEDYLQDSTKKVPAVARTNKPARKRKEMETVMRDATLTDPAMQGSDASEAESEDSLVAARLSLRQRCAVMAYRYQYLLSENDLIRLRYENRLKRMHQLKRQVQLLVAFISGQKNVS